ncbi:hypothetical protein NUSPORA_00659 [Nucleospora cyclopteri]
MKQTKNKVRFQIPFDIECKKCHLIIKEGKKLNVLKVLNYSKPAALEIFNLIIKCPFCSFKLQLQTDPENETYKPKKGCKLPESNNFNSLETDENVEHLRYEAILMANTDIKNLKKAFIEKKSVVEVNREEIFNKIKKTRK